MKTILALILGLATLASAQTGEPILFTAHLTGNTVYVGDGMFTLTGDLFTYRLKTDAGFSQAAIYGPALPGTDGPLLFALQLTACQAPAEDREGFCEFSGRPQGTGAFTLSDQQTADLMQVLWYVTASSTGSTLRGQILQVPEPSVLSIVLAAGASVVGLNHALTRTGPRRTVQVIHRKAEGPAAIREY